MIQMSDKSLDSLNDFDQLKYLCNEKKEERFAQMKMYKAKH